MKFAWLWSLESYQPECSSSRLSWRSRPVSTWCSRQIIFIRGSTTPQPLDLRGHGWVPWLHGRVASNSARQ